MEIFKKINYYDTYEISNKGRIRRNNKILKGSKNSSGYIQITLHNENGSIKKYIHRLVLEYFLDKSDLDVNHIDHNKLNNSIENLEYVTKQENVIKRHVHYGTTQNKYKNCECGNKIWKTSNKCKECDSKNKRKINRPSKEELLELLKDNSYVSIGKMFGVSDNSIRKWVK